MSCKEYTVQGSFAFAETFGQKYSEFLMESLDVDSLFTNIPLKRTIDIWTNTLFEGTERVQNLSKTELGVQTHLLVNEHSTI